MSRWLPSEPCGTGTFQPLVVLGLHVCCLTGIQMGKWLVLSVFWVLCCRKKVSFVRCWSLHGTHTIWGQVQVQEPEWPTTKYRKIHCQKVTFAKKKKKIEGNRGGDVGGEAARTVKTQCTIHSPYLQANRNINTIVLGTKSKHQRKEESFRYCLGSIHIFQQNTSSLKNKQKITRVSYWLVS